MGQSFYEKFKALCDQKGESPSFVLKNLGISTSQATYWKNGATPRSKTIADIARYFGAPLSYFIDTGLTFINQATDISDKPAGAYPLTGVCMMPIIGSVKAGFCSMPIKEYEDGYQSIPTDQLRGYAAGECCLLRVRGDSMYPRIVEGDIVLIHVQQEVECGDIAVVFNGDDEATIKKFNINGDKVELIPANPEYKTKVFTKEEAKNIRIYGKVLSLIRTF